MLLGPSEDAQYKNGVRDSETLLEHANKSLARITFADLLSFAQSLIELGPPPICKNGGTRSIALPVPLWSEVIARE